MTVYDCEQKLRIGGRDKALLELIFPVTGFLGRLAGHGPPAHLALSVPHAIRCDDCVGGKSGLMSGVGLPVTVKLTEGLTVVTHNTREFERIPGIILEDWVEE